MIMPGAPEILRAQQGLKDVCAWRLTHQVEGVQGRGKRAGVLEAIEDNRRHY